MYVGYFSLDSEEVEGSDKHAVDDPEEVVSMVEMWVSLYLFLSAIFTAFSLSLSLRVRLIEHNCSWLIMFPLCPCFCVGFTTTATACKRGTQEEPTHLPVSFVALVPPAPSHALWAVTVRVRPVFRGQEFFTTVSFPIQFLALSLSTLRYNASYYTHMKRLI